MQPCLRRVGDAVGTAAPSVGGFATKDYSPLVVERSTFQSVVQMREFSIKLKGDAQHSGKQKRFDLPRHIERIRNAMSAGDGNVSIRPPIWWAEAMLLLVAVV